MVVWAIASEERDDSVARNFAEALDLTMPVLIDEGGIVHAQYLLQSTVPSAAYPEEWIIGTDGTVVYRATEYDSSAVIATIEDELAGG